MHFDLIDAVLEQSAERIVTIKHVSSAEEYLQDHFPTFPILPGVMMLEAMVQAARRLIESRGPTPVPLVLGQARALKYGRMVKPGDSMRVTVDLLKTPEPGIYEFRGEACVAGPGLAMGVDLPIAAGGKFCLRHYRGAAKMSLAGS